MPMLTVEEKELYEGAIAVRKLNDGRVLVLYPLLWGNVRLTLGPTEDIGYDDFWEYPPKELYTALAAMVHWDGTGDPPDGWHRASSGGDPRGFRRRPDGDPEQEFRAP